MTTYQFGNTPTTVTEGQTVRFRFKAPSAWDSSQNITVKVGLQTTVWRILTLPQDFAPDAFTFTTLEKAEPDTLYTYGDGTRAGETVVTVGGLTAGTEGQVGLTTSHINPTISDVAIRRKRLSQNNNATWGNWEIPTGWTVANGDLLQVRLKSNASFSQNSYLNLTVGTRTEKWTIWTKDQAPNFPDPAPNFLWLEDRPLDSDIYSNIVQIQGMNDFGIVSSDNGAKIGISTTGAYTTNDDGYNVLSGVTFVDSSTQPQITNTQYIQLMVRSPVTANTAIANVITIGTGGGGAIWRIETGDLPSITPDTFIFSNKIDQDEDTLIESDQQPTGGITGLGTDVEVPVTLVTTTGSAPGVRRKRDGSWSSWGIFPTSVVLGDELQIRNKSSATFSAVISTTIKVGSREIAPWSITTNSGPDTDASFTPPGDLTGTAPNTLVVSSIVPITGINRPITINATNDAKISVDFGPFVAGPVAFDDDTNSSFQLQILTNQTLSGVATTSVTVGTGTTNNPFTWTATNYAVVPPPPELKGCWYSKKTAFVDMSGGGSGEIRESKEDGYAIGTVIPILKDRVDVVGEQDPMKQYGDLKGSTNKGRLDARYPGYLDCDGSEYNVADFPDLWWVIKNNYAKPTDDANDFGEWNNTTKAYSGKFRVPDYRNRRMVGPGQVDGNRGASTILPIDTGIHPTKTFNAREAGGIGGYWYVDDVDVTAGDPNPYQQIIGDDPQDTSGITSDFFNFGTVRTVVLDDIVVDIEFEVVGSVTATIGPLSSTQVDIPSHEHIYISAVTAGPGGDPLIAWNQRALFGYTPYNFQNTPTAGLNWLGDRLGRVAYPAESPWAPNGETNDAPWNKPVLYFNEPSQTLDFWDTKSTVRDQWIGILLGFMPDFEEEWDSVFDVQSLEELIDIMMAPIDEDHQQGKDAGALTISAKTWWVHPGDAVKDDFFVDLNIGTTTIYSLNSGGIAAGTAGTATTAGSLGQQMDGTYEIWNAKVMAAIDTEPGTFRVLEYSPPKIYEDELNGSIAEHNHYLSDMPLTDLNADYSYGNADGPGEKQGLGTASEQKAITFNQGDVNLELNVGEFTLNKGTKLPAPNVAFHPNRKVELVNKFHKVKYIIKAF